MTSPPMVPRHVTKLWHILALWLIYVATGCGLVALGFVEPRIFIPTANGATGFALLIVMFTYIQTWRSNK